MYRLYGLPAGAIYSHLTSSHYLLKVHTTPVSVIVKTCSYMQWDLAMYKCLKDDLFISDYIQAVVLSEFWLMLLNLDIYSPM